MARRVRRELMQHWDSPAMPAHDRSDDVGTSSQEVESVGSVRQAIECRVAREGAI